MAPEVIACDENPDSTYDCKVSCKDAECQYPVDVEYIACCPLVEP